MDYIYEIEARDIGFYDLSNIKESQNLNDSLNSRLETILYGEEEKGRTARVKSVTPIYHDSELAKLLVVFEKIENLGIIYSTDEENIVYYSKDYITVFKVGNYIVLDNKDYRIDKIKFDLDYESMVLRVQITEVKL